MPQANFWLVISLLVLASSASIMSTDLYTPSMPHLPEYFRTTPQAVQLTLSLNLLAFGLAQLLFGPLSDRFGRRPVMLGGLLMFSVFSGACALAQSIEQLIVARVLQGFCGSVEAVVGLAMVRDLFAEATRVRALAIWGMAIALTPALAPILGGYIYLSLGWQANFWLIGLVALGVAGCMARYLPESGTPDPAALDPRRVLAVYAALLTTPRFMNYTIMLGASMGVIFAFVTAGPFLMIDLYGVETQHYGYYWAVVVLAYFVGSLLANRLAGRVDLDLVLNVGLLFALGGGLSVAVLHLLGWLGPISLIASFSVLAFGLGPVFAIAPSHAMESLSGNIGAASALIGSGQMVVSALAASGVIVLYDGTPLGLVIVVLLVMLLAASMQGFARWTRQRL